MASVNWEKLHTANEVKAMLKHSATDSRLRTLKHSNEDIDKTKTHKNITYVGSYKETCMEYDKRIKDLEAMSSKRKDRVTCLGLEVPCPYDIKNDEEACRKFFDLTLERIGNQLGAHNVVGAWAHFDEIHDYYDTRTNTWTKSRPHLHVYVVPEREGRLCAKEVMTRTAMKQINREIEQMTVREFGCKFMTGEQRKGPSVEELKAKQDIRRLREHLDRLVKEVDDRIKVQTALRELTTAYIAMERALDQVKEVMPKVEKYLKEEYHFEELKQELIDLNKKYDDGDDHDDNEY